MEQYEIFSILDSVDSTNNYAMAQVRAGLASHGRAWFAHNQTAGKGQRGKGWQSNPGDNILLSILIKPSERTDPNRFIFNAAIALTCIRFLHSLTTISFNIKWPNDIYWNDRKAGGILIENIIQGNQWKWSVIGIGINVNQTLFTSITGNPVSLKNITGRSFDTIALAKLLHTTILESIDQNKMSPVKIMQDYNSLLYKKDVEIQLRKNNVVFKTYIKEVDEFGRLLTHDEINRSFISGEVEWIIP